MKNGHELAWPAAALALALATPALAHGDRDRNPPPISIKEQGGYSYGGTIAGDPNVSSIHCDHGVVQYQIPTKPRKIPLLMWHSASTLTWETTFDGREGFKNIFLRRGYPVYIVDGPRIGRADWGCVPYTYTPDLGRDQLQISTWRLGSWTPPAPPVFYPGVQFPVNNAAALDQMFRGRYLEFETIPNAQLETDETAKLVDDIGPTTILTHSGSGIRGWLTRLKSRNVAGIVAYEPGGFVYPAGEMPPGNTGSDTEVPLSEFIELTKIPIQIIFGDNTDKVPLWRTVVPRAHAFIDAINRHRPRHARGNAMVVHLPSIGIRGNTHFPMADLNSTKIADLLSKWLEKNNLDRK